MKTQICKMNEFIPRAYSAEKPPQRATRGPNIQANSTELSFGNTTGSRLDREENQG